MNQVVGVLQENVDSYAASEPMVKCQVQFEDSDVGLVPSSCLRTLEADEEAELLRHEAPVMIHGNVSVNGINYYLMYHNATDTLYAFGKEPKTSLTQVCFVFFFLFLFRWCFLKQIFVGGSR